MRVWLRVEKMNLLWHQSLTSFNERERERVFAAAGIEKSAVGRKCQREDACATRAPVARWRVIDLLKQESKVLNKPL